MKNEILKLENYNRAFDKNSQWKLHLEKMERTLIYKANKLKRNNFI